MPEIVITAADPEKAMKQAARDIKQLEVVRSHPGFANLMEQISSVLGEIVEYGSDVTTERDVVIELRTLLRTE